MTREFIGTWFLQTVNCWNQDGDPVALFGAAPTGIIMYDEHGAMAVQMRNTDVEPGDGPRLSFAAYWGSYRIDTDKQQAIHHIEGALVPELVGHDELRPYRFQDGCLILSFADLPVGDQAISGDVVWRRR